MADKPLILDQEAATIAGPMHGPYMEMGLLGPTQLQTTATQAPEGMKLAYVPSDYTDVPELAAAMQTGQRNQALFGGGVSLLGEGIQFALGRAATAESRAYSEDRLKELEGTENFVSDAEKMALYESMVAPAKQVAAEQGLRAEKVLASDKLTAREYLDAQKLGVDITQKASVAAGLKTIDLEESRRSEAEKEAEELRAFLFAVDKETLWEPLAKFTGNLGQVIGEIVKYAPGTTYAAEIDDMRKANVPDAIIAKAIKVGKGMGTKGRAKMVTGVIKNYGDKTKTSIPGVSAGAAGAPTVKITEKQQPTTWSDPGDGKYIYKMEGDNITFKSPTSEKLITVKPDNKFYQKILSTRPKA